MLATILLLLAVPAYLLAARNFVLAKRLADEVRALREQGIGEAVELRLALEREILQKVSDAEGKAFAERMALATARLDEAHRLKQSLEQGRGR